MASPVIFQEAVNRGVTFGLARWDEKASQGHLKERLEMAANELELALERSAKLPITDVSLLQRRKMIKRGYVEAMELLKKDKQQAVPPGQELQVAQGVKRKRWFDCAKNMSLKPFVALSTDAVRRFEWYADHAGRFVRDVESGCSLHHNTFCNPIVKHLLEGKTLRYHRLEQGNNLRRSFYIFPMYSDERGVEAQLAYSYMDSTMIEKNFLLTLSLRLSENTDIVGVAIKGLQLLTAEFKLAAECATGELTLLSTISQDAAQFYGPPLVRSEEFFIKQTQIARPDPACCKGSRHGLCANNNVSSELSDIFPEQVILWGFECSIPALESSTRSSFDEVGRGWKPPLRVRIIFSPHYFFIFYLMRWIKQYFIDLWERRQMVKTSNYTYAVESIGDDVEKFINDVSLQEVAETIKSKAINCFSRHPEPREYRIDWASVHGGASFTVENASVETAGVPRTRKKVQYAIEQEQGQVAGGN
ncbi:uncharacterized protein [Miscanthus floridulus]|uniref:uncharacterized protein n=1 Tax=Miscanthus floridulus TaxID=154761 RepID=UPI003457470E